MIIASINELTHIAGSLNISKLTEREYHTKVIVVDEGDILIRKRNNELLCDVEHNFYGPKERKEWFRDHFGSSYGKYLSVIPKKCHAETSFGFLVAYDETADTVVEVDDDVKISNTKSDFTDLHLKNLFNDGGVAVTSDSKWYNTLENLKLSVSDGVFPRGHPYNPIARKQSYRWINDGRECVLNMGLWSGHPDLDALTILINGGLDRRCRCNSKGLKRDKITVAKGTYFAICSMNTSFKRKIIPAFYQLYMKYLGIDRFDDIWSGLFIKKIADQMGDSVCLGSPIVYHDKRPGNTFKDLRAELEGIVMNEILWKVVDKAELNSKDYFSCYAELSNYLEKNLQAFPEKFHRDFVKFQTGKMRLWLKVVDKIG